MLNYFLWRFNELKMEFYDKQLLELKEKHIGQRAFIIGNGPSLTISDLNSLKDEITFGSNRIYLAFEETDWRPSYYSVLDQLVAQNNAHIIETLELKKIFGSGVKQHFSSNIDAIYVNELIPPVTDNRIEFKFSKDLMVGSYGGWTVVYLQMQLAYYMGIKELYLTGIDFKFEHSKSTGKKNSDGEILKQENESNHFHPLYRLPGEEWSIPRLDYQCQAFTVAKKSFEESNGIVRNASRVTALHVFERIDFDSLFNSDNFDRSS